MDVRKAAYVYKQANRSTIPVIEYVLLLLQEGVKTLELYGTAEQPEERKEALEKAQHIVFELMTTVDPKTDEGEGLLVMYAMVNQQLIQARLQGDETDLSAVSAQFQTLLEAWQDVQQRIRLQTYTTPWI